MLLASPNQALGAAPSPLPGLKGLVGQGLNGRRAAKTIQARVAYAKSTGNAPTYVSTGIFIPPVEGSDSDFAYLTPAIYPRTGRWYWEARPIQSSSYFLWGLAVDISSRNYGGYSSANCGYYSAGLTWAGTGISDQFGWLLGYVGLPNMLGFMYDSDIGRFEMYSDGSLGAVFTNIPMIPAYPLFAFQGLNTTAEVRLGKTNVLYGPTSSQNLKYFGYDV